MVQKRKKEEAQEWCISRGRKSAEQDRRRQLRNVVVGVFEKLLENFVRRTCLFPGVGIDLQWM